MLVVAVVGKKKDSGYYAWAKILLILFTIFIIIDIYVIGSTLIELEELLEENN